MQRQRLTNGGLPNIFKVLESNMKNSRTELSYSAKTLWEPEDE